MSTDLSTIRTTAGEQIRQTLGDFRRETMTWEAEVKSLFQDIDHFLAGNSALPSPSNAPANEITGLRSLIEQQTDVLTALVNALTGPQAAGSDPKGASDDVIDSVLGQFEQLHGATAAD